ncbi:MAG: response regulator [Deltaproteobacteria bacterium]|nr:response regulator [Deltaproteobacteria bacterium]
MDIPNILVVDDSAVFRQLLLKQLDEFGSRVTQAEDGQQGLERALSEPFDLIISDVEMPRMNGFKFCKEIKNNPTTRNIPVIMLSSLDSDTDIDKGFQAGAAAYISKAEANGGLCSTIERVLEKFKSNHRHLILVVDDSLTIRALVQKGLETAGFKVAIAENGKQALALIEKNRPNLILSDINMPVMDGIELCKTLHTTTELASIPFVTMSSNSDRSIMRRMMEWGASAYLVKPFNLEQVVITVEKLLSDHFLIVLKDKQRLEAERSMMLASITSLIVALEARDHYTRGHSEAVATLVSGMAAQMNMNPDEIESLGIAGRLHDIGKIGVPDNILLKAGRLTEAEMSIVRQHPSIGASILGSNPSIRELIPVIRHHHERFDGKGYPDGLKGTQIPLWARMTAVADTYHALTSDRSYRRGMSQGKTLSIIEDVRGTQLCPECVDIFIDFIFDFVEEGVEGETPQGSNLASHKKKQGVQTGRIRLVS